MPYLLMNKAYDYDDQFYYEQEGGYSDLVFDDEQRFRAVKTLNAHRRGEWSSCTPLEIFCQEQPLSDVSSSGLGSDALSLGVSAVLQKPLNAQELLEFDFQSYPLTDEQNTLSA